MTVKPRFSPDVQQAIARHVLRTIIENAKRDRTAVIAACDAALEILAPSEPHAAPHYEDTPQQMRDWAEWASDTAAVEMLRALLTRFERRPINSTAARKRGFMAIWNTLSAAESAAFLDAVDPGSSAKG